MIYKKLILKILLISMFFQAVHTQCFSSITIEESNDFLISCQKGKNNVISETVKNISTDDLNTPGEDGSTLLTIAAICNNIYAIKTILKRDDVDVNIPNSYGLTALHIAVTNKCTEAVELLLKNPTIDVNTCPNKFCIPALYIACLKGDLHMVKLLLKCKGIDVNTVNYINGQSPLLLSTKMERKDIVKAILKKSDVNVDQSTYNDVTPFMIAIVNNNIDISNMLIKKGAQLSINQLLDKTQKVFSVLIQNENPSDEVEDVPFEKYIEVEMREEYILNLTLKKCKRLEKFLLDYNIEDMDINKNNLLTIMRIQDLSQDPITPDKFPDMRSITKCIPIIKSLCCEII